jgi:hypothetical protein
VVRIVREAEGEVTDLRALDGGPKKGPPARGPAGLLAALVDRGLSEEALPFAAQLCLELDRQARQRNEREAAA